MNTLIHQVRYYRLLQQRNKGLHTHENLLQKVRDKAGVTWDRQYEGKIKHRLHLTWKQIDEHKATIVKKLEEHLQELS